MHDVLAATTLEGPYGFRSGGGHACLTLNSFGQLRFYLLRAAHQLCQLRLQRAAFARVVL